MLVRAGTAAAADGGEGCVDGCVEGCRIYVWISSPFILVTLFVVFVVDSSGSLATRVCINYLVDKCVHAIHSNRTL